MFPPRQLCNPSLTALGAHSGLCKTFAFSSPRVFHKTQQSEANRNTKALFLAGSARRATAGGSPAPAARPLRICPPRGRRPRPRPCSLPQASGPHRGFADAVQAAGPPPRPQHATRRLVPSPGPARTRPSLSRYRWPARTPSRCPRRPPAPRGPRLGS